MGGGRGGHKKPQNDTIGADLERIRGAGDVMYGTPEHIRAIQKPAQPPQPFSESTLLSKMDSLGIGRPSTYQHILDSISKSKYVETYSCDGTPIEIHEIVLRDGQMTKSDSIKNIGVVKNKLRTTALGNILVEYLCRNFGTIMDYEYTARLKHDVNEVASGDRAWCDVVTGFYGEFSNSVSNIKSQYKQNPDHNKRKLGSHDGVDVYAYRAKYGPVVRKGGGGDAVYAKIPDDFSVDTITLRESIALFEQAREKSNGSKKRPTIDITCGGETYSVFPARGKYGNYLHVVSNKKTKRRAKPIFIALKNHKNVPLEQITASDIQTTMDAHFAGTTNARNTKTPQY